MRYSVISSGSEGNCTLIRGKNINILIDCGITKKKLVAGLASSGLGIEDISVLLITHSHKDHIAGIRFIPKDKWRCVYGTFEDEELRENQYLAPYVPVVIDGLKVTPFALSHDAPCVGYLVEEEGEKLTYITDTGYVSQKVIDLCKDSTYYIFESNHDVKMLYESSRPIYLVRRISSDKGHLDNKASAFYLTRMIGSHTEEVTLAHLSRECNTPELAMESFKEVMKIQLGEVPNVLLRCGSVTDIVKGGK